MKKLFIYLGLLLIFLIVFSGVNKNNAIVLTVDLDSSQNYQTWTDLDLSAYTSNKLGKCLLYCEVLSYETDPTEFVYLKFRPKGADNIEPIEIRTRYAADEYNPETTRDTVGVVECWTDDDGILQWYSDYGQPVERTITLQIKIMININ